MATSLLTDDENDLFPSDQITSDPTFFDDYIPPRSSRSLSLAIEKSATKTRADSPIGGIIRNIWTSAENSTAPRIADNNPCSELTKDDELGGSQVVVSKVVSIATRSPSRNEQQDFRSVDPERLATPTDTRHIRKAGDTEQSIPSSKDVENEEEMVGNMSGRVTLRLVNVSMVEPDAAGLRGIEAFPDAEVSGNRDRMRHTGTAATDRRRRSTRSRQSVRAQSSSRTSADSSHSTRRLHRALSTPALVQSGHSRATKSSATIPTVRTSLAIRTNGLSFSIVEAKQPQHHAYSVKHESESGSQIGDQWLEANKRAFFHIHISESARVKYATGDIVSVAFPRGQGGDAKIIELRVADELLIVVQWIYSRTDANEAGGALPRLEQWPRGHHMLSDHFQILCIENIMGKSGATVLEDFYWAAVHRRIQPIAKLDTALRKQLA